MADDETDERAIRRLADELFITTDQKDWPATRALFADGPIEADMSSLAGGGPVRVTADELLAGFRAGLHAGKASHHLATNYRVRVVGGRHPKTATRSVVSLAMTPFGDSQSHRLALVTGTSSGIGSALAKLLLEQSWAVVGVARRPARIDHPRYRHLLLDLADLTRVTTCFEQEVAPLVADQRWQRVSLVNNAASADLLMSVEQVDPGVPVLQLEQDPGAASGHDSAQRQQGRVADAIQDVPPRCRHAPRSLRWLRSDPSDRDQAWASSGGSRRSPGPRSSTSTPPWPGPAAGEGRRATSGRTPSGPPPGASVTS